MTKFLLGIAIVAFTTFCGYVLSKKYRKRKTFFCEWTTFNERFLNEISYYRRPLQAFFEGYSYKGEFSELLQGFLYCTKNRLPMRENVLDTSAFSFLTTEEKRAVDDYFSMLGKGDVQSQRTFFQGIGVELVKRENEGTAALKKYGDLYIKLGFLCGLLLLILIM